MTNFDPWLKMQEKDFEAMIKGCNRKIGWTVVITLSVIVILWYVGLKISCGC